MNNIVIVELISKLILTHWFWTCFPPTFKFWNYYFSWLFAIKMLLDQNDLSSDVTL